MKTKIKVSVLLASTALSGTMVQASSDYGPAIWNPAYPGHWYTSGYGHKFHVIHDMEGYYLSTISYFQKSTTSASVHYCVNGLKDTSTDHAAGEITQMVLEAYYAWHALCWNTYCTGTEHEGFASNPAWYSDAQYQASAGITSHIASKFGYAKDRNHIVGHNEWQNSNWTAWAGPNFGINTSCNTHHDPGVYWDWTKYMNMINPPAPTGCDLASRGVGMLDLFYKGSDNAIWIKSYSSGAWIANDTSLGTGGGTIASDPSAISWGQGRLDVFAVRTDGAIVQITYGTNGVWGAWTMVTGTGVAKGGCAVASRQVGGLDLFYWGTDGNIWILSYLSSHGWYPATSLGTGGTGGVIASRPGAVSWSSNRLDVVAIRADAAIVQRSYDTNGWSAWVMITGTSTAAGSPTLASRQVGGLDCFYRGSDNALWILSYTAGHGWYPATSLGTGGNGATLAGADPGAVSWGGGRLDVTVTRTDNWIAQRSYDTNGWNAWVMIDAKH